MHIEQNLSLLIQNKFYYYHLIYFYKHAYNTHRHTIAPRKKYFCRIVCRIANFCKCLASRHFMRNVNSIIMLIKRFDVKLWTKLAKYYLTSEKKYFALNLKNWFWKTDDSNVICNCLNWSNFVFFNCFAFLLYLFNLLVNFLLNFWEMEHVKNGPQERSRGCLGALNFANVTFFSNLGNLKVFFTNLYLLNIWEVKLCLLQHDIDEAGDQNSCNVNFGFYLDKN